MTHTIRSAKFHCEDGRAVRLVTDQGEEIVDTGQAILHHGLSEFLAAGGTIAPYYTIIGAQYGDAEGKTVWVRTEEAGRVLVTDAEGKRDRKAALEKWVAAGGEIAAYVPPPPPEPTQEQKRAAVLDAIIAKAEQSGKSIEEVIGELGAEGEPDPSAPSDQVAKETLSR